MEKIKKIINKKDKSKIICLTAYSKNIAAVIDEFTDLILVGDSLGFALYGYNTTRKVTLKMMIEHAKSVRLGVVNSLLVVDMPYNTYRTKSEALKNCKKVIKETKCDAIKLEGGMKIVPIIKHLVENKIFVMGHLGILPQSVKGRFRFKGKKIRERTQMFKDAKGIEQAGVFSFVLEGVEKSLARLVTKNSNVPTIGIGASVHCDGQVLVTDDLLGLTQSKIKFVKEFTNIRKTIKEGVKKYRSEVIAKKFPNKKYSY
tara:strand:+ start:931 stop:1704 length:774 start_codon:yes stop_codon:yes gene_type:complete